MVVILVMRFFFAMSKTWISLVIFRTTASDSVAFSRIRDIWLRSSFRGDYQYPGAYVTRACAYRDHFLDDLHLVWILIPLEFGLQSVYLSLKLSFTLSKTGANRVHIGK